MSISDLHPQPSPAAVLGDVVSMVRDLDATWWTNQTDDDLAAFLRRLPEGEPPAKPAQV